MTDFLSAEFVAGQSVINVLTMATGVVVSQAVTEDWDQGVSPNLVLVDFLDGAGPVFVDASNLVAN